MIEVYRGGAPRHNKRSGFTGYVNALREKNRYVRTFLRFYLEEKKKSG